MNVDVKNQANNLVTFGVPLSGFDKAFDGPPIDPKVLEEQQKKLQAELQKRAEDERKKLEAAKPDATGGAAPPTAAPRRLPLPQRLPPLRPSSKHRLRAAADFSWSMIPKPLGIMLLSSCFGARSYPKSPRLFRSAR